MYAEHDMFYLYKRGVRPKGAYGSDLFEAMYNEGTQFKGTSFKKG